MSSRRLGCTHNALGGRRREPEPACCSAGAARAALAVTAVLPAGSTGCVSCCCSWMAAAATKFSRMSSQLVSCPTSFRPAGMPGSDREMKLL
jgi:hypothetical protein